VKSSAGRTAVAIDEDARWNEEAGSKSWVALPIASSGRFSAMTVEELEETSELESAACWADAAHPVKVTADNTNKARTREEAFACVAVAVPENEEEALIAVRVQAHTVL